MQVVCRTYLCCTHLHGHKVEVGAHLHRKTRSQLDISAQTKCLCELVLIYDFVVGELVTSPVTETIIEEINEVEPFIEDYYPKIKVEEEPYTLVEEETEVVIPFNNPIEEINEPVIIEINNNINENESNINEKIIESVKEENTERDYNIPNNKQLYVRYVYPPMYYRPIIYIIPKNKRTH